MNPPVSETPRPSSRLQRWVLAGCVVAAAGLVGVGLKAPRSGEEEPGEEAAGNAVVAVKVDTAIRGNRTLRAVAIGTVYARVEATVSAKLAAPIRRMPLLKNRHVKEGELLAELETADLHAQRGAEAAALNEAEVVARSMVSGSIPQNMAQGDRELAQARAAATTAAAVLERRKELFEKGAISKKEIEASRLALVNAQNDLLLAERTRELKSTVMNPNDIELAHARVEQARQRVALLDTQIGYGTIRSPLAGVVTAQYHFQGEFASAGERLVTIADVDHVVVRAPVSPDVAAQLVVGASAEIFPQGAPGASATGRMTLVSPTADPVSHAVEIWVEATNESGQLRPGSAARVVLPLRTVADAVWVPAAAVTVETADPSRGTVMVATDDAIAHARPVVVGSRDGDLVQVLEGVKAGERIVTAGSYALPDGSRVHWESAEKAP